MENINYFTIMPRTHEERVKDYMKCKKKDLAEWLATSNEMYCPEMHPVKLADAATCTYTASGDGAGSHVATMIKLINGASKT